ncbi:C-4 sterol methyl oxidase [Apophysomyces ossiformis]|uniref:C-4 sterol methyl oxidase n=1 Tax=Apophysomyces ossiformis TaxID=679940 RepID=A0A8H7BSA7_9FUNG|nr:C-4 sterol methyl oxidase [Apophysomyces ossiformis]
MLTQISIFFVVEDFFHYVAHRLLHQPWLYRKVHKVHHQYAAPFGIASEYAHPVETCLFNVVVMSGPLIYHAITKHFLYLGSEWDLHLFTVLAWGTLRLLQAIDSHSGYDFPWSLRQFIPFWAGSDHHDYHHQAFTGNYASSFRWWDYIFGTDKKYREYRKLQRLERMKDKTR